MYIIKLCLSFKVENVKDYIQRKDRPLKDVTGRLETPPARMGRLVIVSRVRFM